MLTLLKHTERRVKREVDEICMSMRFLWSQCFPSQRKKSDSDSVGSTWWQKEEVTEDVHTSTSKTFITSDSKVP